jgi:predicted nucleotidyltransferase component of viral defense system
MVLDQIDFRSLYFKQDIILKTINQCETSFYLTGGTCLNRFYLEKRYSEDLDFFTNDNQLYREDIQRIIRALKNDNIHFSMIVDTRDFVRILAENDLKVDLVNDRIYRYGKSLKTNEGYSVDNLWNILSNKITAILGRDEPKDVFDLYIGARLEPFPWKEILYAASQKAVFDLESLEYRLRSFPINLLDNLNITDPEFLENLKRDLHSMIDDIAAERTNSLCRA